MASYNPDSSGHTYAHQEPSEPEQPFVVRLTPTVHNRLMEFITRGESVGLRQSDVMDTILNVCESSRVEVEKIPSPRKRGRSTETTPVIARRSMRIHVRSSGYTEPEPEERMVVADEEELNFGDEYVYENSDGDDDDVNAEPPTRNLPSVTNYSTSSPQKRPAKKGRLPQLKRMVMADKPKISTITRVIEQVMTPRTMKKQCHPERKGIGTGKQKPWTSNLRRYLYNIIVKWQRDELLHCRECDRWMRVVHKSCGLRCVNALDHICGHVGKPMFTCQLCARQTITSIQMRKHLKSAHGRTNEFDDLTESYFDELEERITRCFDYSDVGEPPVGPRRLLTLKKKPGEVCVGRTFLNQDMDADAASVRRYVYDLIAKWQQENMVYCRECDRWVRLGKESAWSQSQAAMAHICGHYSKPLFVCLLCEERTITMPQMIRHIKHVHQAISRGNCLEEADFHQGELKDVAKNCFDWDEGTCPPDLTPDGPFLKKRKERLVSEKKRRGQRQDNSCRPAALETARRFIRALPAKSTRLKCRVCGSVATVKSTRGVQRPEVLFAHALGHIRGEPYSCRYCDKTTKKGEQMRLHVTLYHKKAPTVDYIDNTADKKDQILRTLKRCYDHRYDDSSGEEEPEIEQEKGVEQQGLEKEADSDVDDVDAQAGISLIVAEEEAVERVEKRSKKRSEKQNETAPAETTVPPEIVVAELQIASTVEVTTSENHAD